MKKTPLRTSLRSSIQTTDSTRSGWIAKIAATKADFQNEPVIFQSKCRSKRTEIEWRMTFVRWNAPGLKPSNWNSIMCEMFLSGNQFVEGQCVNAHAML